MNSNILKEEILNTGNELVKKGSEAGPLLRKLQSKLHKLETADSHMNFLGFFLFSLIDDLYFNLSGDFPYDEESDRIIDSIFKSIGQLLVKLEHTLRSDNPKDCYEIYVEMVKVYLKGLTEVEDATSNK
jgi:hypothetical protein